MALLGLTSAQAKLAKWLLRQAGTVLPAGLAWLGNDLVANTAAPSTLEWRRYVVQWARSTPTGTLEDLAQCKIDLMNVTSDELDVTWTSGDYAAVLALFQTWLTAMTPLTGASQTFVRLKAYRMSFNPTLDITRPFADTGMPVYSLDFGMVGTAASVLPYQLAPTVTFRTAWPKHWGRAYNPTPGTAHLDTNGRLTSTYRTSLGTAWKTLLGGLHDAGFYPVVPVGQLDKQPFHALLGVQAVVVDDVPDVQRRRRPKIAAARTVA